MLLLKNDLCTHGLDHFHDLILVFAQIQGQRRHCSSCFSLRASFLSNLNKVTSFKIGTINKLCALFCLWIFIFNHFFSELSLHLTPSWLSVYLIFKDRVVEGGGWGFFPVNPNYLYRKKLVQNYLRNSSEKAKTSNFKLR